MSTKPPPKRRGRPPKRPNEKRGEYLDVRLEASEKQAFKDAAALAGLPVSNWVRERLRVAARSELQDAGRSVAFLKSLSEFIEGQQDG